MRPVRPQEQVEEIKQSVLDTALVIIAQEGFNALTMRRLGRELGMTAPNLYNYFNSKDEIYITLMIQGFTRLREYMVQVSEAAANPFQRARDVMHAYLRFGFEHPHHYELMFSSHAPKTPDYKGTPEESLSEQEFALGMEVARFAETVLDLALEGVGLKATPDQRRTMLIELWSLLHGMVSLHLTGNSSYLTDRVVETYEHILDLLLERFINQHLMSKK